MMGAALGRQRKVLKFGIGEHLACIFEIIRNL